MSKGIFDGLKVCDFTWAGAGPITTKQLSDNGATVVKVESFKHPDSIRLGGPFIDNKPADMACGIHQRIGGPPPAVRVVRVDDHR